MELDVEGTLTERGHALVARGQDLSPDDRDGFRDEFLDWRRTVEQVVADDTAREVRRLVGPRGLFGGGGPEAYARSGGMGRFGGPLDVSKEWTGPMSELLALLEVELPGVPAAPWPLQDVQRALDAVADVDAASLASALELVIPGGRLEEVRPDRHAFVGGGMAAVVDHVSEGADPEPALHAFLEDLTALVVHPADPTEVVFVLWCADDTVDSRLASLRTELSAPDGRIVRTHPLRRPPPGGRR